MSVSEVRLHSMGSGGTATGSDDGDVALSYNAAWRAKCSSASDAADTVLSHFRQDADLPWPGRPFRFANGFDVTSITKTVDAKYIENSDGWYAVNVTFGPQKGEEQKQENQTPAGNTTSDPMKWHDEISVGFTQISIPVEAAIFKGWTKLGVNNPAFIQGKNMALMNSATKPFDPTIEEEVDIKVIRITRNVRAYDGSIITQYQGALNSDRVTINKPAYKFRESFGLYHGRIKSITADFVIANGFPYYRNSIEVHVFPPGRYGWLRLVLDQGIEELYKPEDKRPDGTTVSFSDLPSERQYEIKTITDEEGLPITSPVRLNGNGKALKPEEEAVYGIWQTRSILPFSSIPW